MKPILQIALDITDLFKAVELGMKIISSIPCKNIWLEVGTPLIKTWGRIAVRVLKDLTNCFIVADTKTMDIGDLEAEIMYKAGADAFTVLGVADNETIKEALKIARRYRKILIVDLINHSNPFNRAIELDRLGVDVILYHIGIDVQRKYGITASTLFSELKNLRKNIGAKIAVAGGIKHEDIDKLLDINVDIIVVGSAIIKADNPVESTRLFMKKLGLL